jgi:hypothetical protein
MSIRGSNFFREGAESNKNNSVDITGLRRGTQAGRRREPNKALPELDSKEQENVYVNGTRVHSKAGVS